MEPPFLENVRVGGKPKDGPDQPAPREVVAERNGKASGGRGGPLADKGIRDESLLLLDC